MIKVIFNNKNYNIDESALAPAMAALEAHLGELDPSATAVPFTVTSSNLSKIGYTGAAGESLVIPAMFQDIDGAWYKVAAIGNGAFAMCDQLTSITIPNTVTNIGNEAFQWCEALEMVAFETGSQLTSIGKGAFEDCALTSIIIPDSVTSIGDYAFDSCDELTSIIIPDGVTSIGKLTFSSCKLLNNISLGEGIVSIGERAFESCKALTNIHIPKNVTSIATDAFSNCQSLTEISVDSGNNFYKAIDGVLYTKDGTVLVKYASNKSATHFTIPDGVARIERDACRSCKNLTHVVIPDSVGIIDSYAFRSCEGLTSVTIGNGVTTIADGAFLDCTALTNVNYIGTEDQWNAITIEIDNEPLTNATIHYNYQIEE